MKFSVVIPARDEAENIGATLDALRARLAQEAISYEIIVVDDGSADATLAAARACCGLDPGVRLIENPGPHGFGYAVRRGLDAMTGDAVAIVMADGSDSPDDLVRYFYVVRDEAECAFGSRFVRGSRVEHYPPVKRVLNRLVNHFIRLLFGLRYNDVTNAFKAYRADVIAGCRPLLSPHFNLTVELPLKAIVRGYTYAVVPIAWRERVRGSSRLRLKEMGSRYLYIILAVWLEKVLTRDDYRRRAAGTPGPVPAGGRAAKPPRPRTPAVGLVVVLLLGAALRLWATGLGQAPVPFQVREGTRVPVTPLTFQIDEDHNVRIPTTLDWRRLNPHAFYLPSLLWYLYFLLDQGIFWIGWDPGRGAAWAEFQRLAESPGPTALFLWARVFNAALGTATVALVYLLGRRLFSDSHGLLAAGFLAVAFLHIRDSALATTDTPTAAFVTLSLVGAAGILRNGRWRDDVLAGVGAGLATATKYNAVVVLLAAAAAHVIRRTRSAAAGSWRATLLAVAGIGLVTGLVFLSCDPYLLLDWPAAWADITENAIVFAHGRFVDVGPGWWYHGAVSLRYGMGLGLLALALAGIAWTVWRRHAGGWVLLSFAGLFYAVLGPARLVHVRYMTPLLPVLCVFSAVAVLALTESLRGPRARVGVATTLVVLATLEPLNSALAYGRLVHQVDTRVQAYEYLLTLPVPSGVATYGPSEVWRSVIPRWQPLYYAKDPAQTWDEVFTVLKTRQIHHLLVHTSPLSVFSPPFPDLEEALRRSATLLKEFSPYAARAQPRPVYEMTDPFYIPIGHFAGVRRPGPVVRVYRLD